MASGEYSNAGLVQKLTPLVKGGQVFGKSVQNGGDFQLVKSAYKIHTSPTLTRASVSKEKLDCEVRDDTHSRDEPYEGSLTRFVRRRTSSIDSQGSVEEELSLLRKKVEQQEQSLESLKLTILSVREESTCQKQLTERVTTKFRSHRSLIDRTLRQTQLALQEQQAMLCRQEILVKKFEREQSVGSSVFLESAYILLGMYIIQTPLVKYTVHLISVNLDRRGRHARWLPRFMQILFFMHFVKLCRALNSYMGFSSGIQSVFSWLGTSLTNLVSRMTGFKQNMLTYDSAAYQNWVRSTEENRQGFNLMDQHRLINTTKGAATTKSLNIC